MARELRPLSIFISSPKDVNDEREALARVVERLNHWPGIRERFVLRALAYEAEVPPVVGTAAQATVDHYMRAADADIFVCMLWSRMGTPVIDETTGEHFPSGTQYEFSKAYERFQATSSKPRMLLYRCLRPISPCADPKQLQQLQEFFEKFEGDDTPNRDGMYAPYTSVAELEARAFRDLAALIAKHFCAAGDLDRLRTLLMDWNRRQIRASVGDKYRSDLYVERTFEDEVRAFLHESDACHARCLHALQMLLEASQEARTAGIRGASADAIAALQSADFSRSAEALERVVELAKPAWYESALRAIAEYERLLLIVSEEQVGELEDAIWRSVPTEGSKSIDAASRSIGAHLDRLRAHRRFSTRFGPPVEGKQKNPVVHFQALRDAVRRVASNHRPAAHASGAVTWERLQSDRSALLRATEQNCLVVVDAAGTGKTNLAVGVALHDAWQLPTIVLFGKALERARDMITPAIERALRHCGHDSLSELLETYDADLRQAQKHVLVMIDGINEYMNDSEMAQMLRRLVAEYAGRRIRFLVTCRDIYWTHFREELQGKEFRIAHKTLTRFNDLEFGQAKERYQRAYGLKCEFHGAAEREFRKPILLRFFCEAYGTRDGSPALEAPKRIRNLTLKKLFDDYLRAKLIRAEEMSHSRVLYAGKVKDQRAVHRAITAIARHMRKVGEARLHVKTAMEVANGGEEASRGSPYGLALDEDILIEEQDGIVYFVYEAFMEYVIAADIIDTDAGGGLADTLLESAIGDARRFGNMRGVVPFLLVMLAESKRRTFLFGRVAAEGEDWHSVVTTAIQQLSTRDRMHGDVVSALVAITKSGKTEDKREAMQLLLARTGKPGRDWAVQIAVADPRYAQQLRQAPTRFAIQLFDAVVAQESPMRGAAHLLDEVRLRRRLVTHLLDRLRSSKRHEVLLALKLLRGGPAGERSRVIRATEPLLSDPRQGVAAAAQDCLALLSKARKGKKPHPGRRGGSTAS